MSLLWQSTNVDGIAIIEMELLKDGKHVEILTYNGVRVKALVKDIEMTHKTDKIVTVTAIDSEKAIKMNFVIDVSPQFVNQELFEAVVDPKVESIVV